MYAKPKMKEQVKPANMHKYWFGTNDAYTREARMNYQAMQKKLESEERELLYRLKDEVRNLNISLRDLKLYRDSLLKLAQDDLEVSLKDYQGGLVGFLDVLEAEKLLLKHRLLMAREKIRSAEILLREEAYRDSISRSYYGIFSAIRAVLATKGLDSGKHSGVISLFNKEFVKTGDFPKYFSKILKKAQIKREDSDYEEFANITRGDAEILLKEAKELVEAVEERVKEFLT